MKEGYSMIRKEFRVEEVKYWPTGRKNVACVMMARSIKTLQFLN